MARKYHILAGIHVESDDGKFEYIFGDYNRNVVAQERLDEQNSGQYKKMRIITLMNDSQSTIEEEIKLLNS